MTRLETRLADILAPIRDVSVGGILEVMADALDHGAEVRPEPMIRDPNGKSAREGPLKLPRRGDLYVVRNGCVRIQRVETERQLNFKPVTVVATDGFAVIFSPFTWNECEVLVEANQSEPDWGPLRRWFLEWIQSRFTEVSPDLEGAVHSLTGPVQTPEGWQFILDLGSAPIDCMVDLMDAFAESGASCVRIGSCH